MKHKSKFFLIVIVVLILFGGYLFISSLFKESNQPLNTTTADLVVHSNELIKDFSINEKQSVKIYAGKIIEVKGVVEEINYLNNKTTLILKGDDSNFGIICEMNPIENDKVAELKPNDSILIKGICKGYLKDVILLNCALQQPTNE